MFFKEGTFQLSQNTYTPNVSFSKREATLYYPCPTSDACTSYYFSLIPGLYRIKAYGASSQNKVSLARDETKSKFISQEESKIYGGNAKCYTDNGVSGSGGYISGIITLKQRTFFYANIGGSGVYTNKNPPGGYNGGADGGASKCSSGGGGTDLRVGVDDFWHRIIVAGGGGGIDTSQGSGGSGGYPEGQGFWDIDEYNKTVATQTSGYKFGVGGSPYDELLQYDAAGAGGGWFGGYPGNSYSSGAGGGSSFILTTDAELPENPDGKPYAYSNNSPYIFCEVQHATGIWEGNGKLQISILAIFDCGCTGNQFNMLNCLFYIFIAIYLS